MPGELDPQAQAYLDEIAKLGYRPMYEMTPAESRACFGDLIARFGGSAEPIGRIEDREIEGPAGKLPARVYTPDGDGPFPLLVFFMLTASLPVTGLLRSRLFNDSPIDRVVSRFQLSTVSRRSIPSQPRRKMPMELRGG